MSHLPSRAMALTGSIFAIITGTLMLAGIAIAIVEVRGFINGPGILIASLVGLTELTGIILGGIGCAARAGPILANAIIFSVLTLLALAGVAMAERLHPLILVSVLLHVLTMIFLWVGFPQAARYRRALASDAVPSTGPARPRAVAAAAAKPAARAALEGGAATEGDAADAPRVLNVTLQKGISIMRGSLVLLPDALYFVCANKGGMMGAVLAAAGEHFGLIGGALGGLLGGLVDGAHDAAASKTLAQMTGELDELVAKHKGSFKLEPGGRGIEIGGKSFWSTGFIRSGNQKWIFRNGMPKECRAPLKEWCVANGIAHRKLG